jgi:hypothetical protein
MWRAVPVTPRHMVFLLCEHRPSLHAEGLINRSLWAQLREDGLGIPEISGTGRQCIFKLPC